MTIESLATLWVAIASTFKHTSRKSTLSLIKRVKTTPTLLTHTLPQLGKCVHQSLSTGIIVIPKGLFFIHKGWETPSFLHEYFSLIYDKQGYLKEKADPVRIRELLTLCFMFYKLEQPFSPQQVEEALSKYCITDESVKRQFTLEQVNRIKGTFQSLLPEDPFDIVPHHSNGATADRFSNIDKNHIVRHIPMLQRVYKLQWFYNTKSHALLDLENLRANTLKYGSRPTARLAFVPKDSRGPRSICMEPHEIMKIQKGLQQKIYDFIETPGNPGYRRVNFTDQTINQRLAYLGSLDGSLATIDMKDASDMVSWELIQRLCNADWLDALTATRSEIVTLPNGTERKIYKYASMGSALCFPIEAILFFSIAKTITDNVWVYGDDIIVPTADADRVIHALEEYGLLINRDKTLTQGFFRESCGGDFYRGANITPLRLKKTDLITVVAFANNMAKTFNIDVGRAVIEWYESINHEIILRLHPENENYSPLIAFYDYRENSILFPRKWNKDLQRYELRSLTAVTKILKTPSYDGPASEYNEFFAWLTSKQNSSQPNADEALDELLACVTPYQNYNVSFEGSVSNRTRLSKPKICFRWASFIS